MWIKIHDDLYNLDHVVQITVDKNKDNPFAKYNMYLYHDKQSNKTGSVTRIEFLKQEDMLLVYKDILHKTGCPLFEVNAEDMKRFDEMADQAEKDGDEVMAYYEEYSDEFKKNTLEVKDGVPAYDLGKDKVK